MRSRPSTSRASARRRSRDAPPFTGGAVGFFGYDLVRTVEPLGDRRTRPARAARHGADALRRAGRSSTTSSTPSRSSPTPTSRPSPTSSAPTRAAAARSPRCARARRSRAARRAARPSARAMPAFESNMPREHFEAMVRADRRVHLRRRRLPGRALPALVGARAGARRSRSTAGCARSTRARTCTSWTSATSRSRARAPSRC